MAAENAVNSETRRSLGFHVKPWRGRHFAAGAFIACRAAWFGATEIDQLGIGSRGTACFT